MVDFKDQDSAISLNDDALSKVSGGTQEEDTIQVRCPECGEVFRITGYKRNLTCPACHKPFKMSRPIASAGSSKDYDSIIVKC